MQTKESMKVLFIAGFGPIVPDNAAGRKLYREIFGISFKEDEGGYLHTDHLNGGGPEKVVSPHALDNQKSTISCSAI